MKKILITTITALMLTTLVGCGNNTETTITSSDNDTTSSVSDITNDTSTDIDTTDSGVVTSDTNESETSSAPVDETTNASESTEQTEENVCILPPEEEFDFHEHDTDPTHYSSYNAETTELMWYNKTVTTEEGMLLESYKGTETHIIYPAELGGKPVVSGLYNVQDWNPTRTVRVVKFADGMTKIPNYAMKGAIEVEQIILPDILTEIGYEAFMWCDNVDHINIPDNVVKIGQNAFDLYNKDFTATYRGKTYTYDEIEQLYADINANGEN